MENNSFSRWCRIATGKIKFSPDREAVALELQQHMEDRYDALIEQGLPPEEAAATAISAMGSAEELAPQLAEVHKPFWGYTELVFRWIFRIALALFLFFCLGRTIYLVEFTSYTEADDYMFDPTYRGSGVYQTHYSEPGVSQSNNGYDFTLTRAAVWSTSPVETLYFHMEVHCPTPWADSPDIGEYLWAEDSLGNQYRYFYDRSFLVYSDHTGPMTHVYRCFVQGPSFEGAQWVDIHYSRDGRDLTWRIDLTGGASA